jgi:UDP-glucose 4-epimerase
LATNHEVFVLAKHWEPGNRSSAAHWIKKDLTESFDDSLLPGRLDAIIHLAQSRFYRDFPEQAQDIFDVNTRSTVQLLECGRRAGIERFIFASSGGVYGVGDKAFVETDSANPTNFYLNSKWCSEELIAQYDRIFSTVVLRPFFIYGEGQASSMLVPRLINSVRQGNPIALQGQDGMRINPIHVGDAAVAFERALTLEGSQVINVAGPEVVSLREIGNIIGEEVDRIPVFEVHASQRRRDLIGDLARMKSLLGTPQMRFREGIHQTLRED